MLPDTQVQKSQVKCWIFDILFLPFPFFHWDQFSHWQQVWLFLQPVAGEMRKLMFTGGMELALLLAVFVQLHLFTVCVNINLHVLLCCHHFSFQWKQQTVIVGDVFFFHSEHIFGRLIFLHVVYISAQMHHNTNIFYWILHWLLSNLPQTTIEWCVYKVCDAVNIDHRVIMKDWETSRSLSFCSDLVGL